MFPKLNLVPPQSEPLICLLIKRWDHNRIPASYCFQLRANPGSQEAVFLTKDVVPGTVPELLISTSKQSMCLQLQNTAQIKPLSAGIWSSG